jgi:hypothetical protein
MRIGLTVGDDAGREGGRCEVKQRWLLPAGVAGALVAGGKQGDDPRHLAAGALAALGRVADRATACAMHASYHVM